MFRDVRLGAITVMGNPSRQLVMGQTSGGGRRPRPSKVITNRTPPPDTAICDPPNSRCKLVQRSAYWLEPKVGPAVDTSVGQTPPPLGFIPSIRNAFWTGPAPV